MCRRYAAHQLTVVVRPIQIAQTKIRGKDAFKASPQEISMKALRILFFVFLLAPARFLHAQIEDRPLMSVNIPFAFTVENVRLPAGRYVVSMVELNRLWRLSSADHKTNTLLHISANEDAGLAKQSKLIFRHYETDYVLREIMEQRRGTAATLPTGKRERQLAQINPHPEIAMIEAQSE
jgi:hypothetical protein